LAARGRIIVEMRTDAPDRTAVLDDIAALAAAHAPPLDEVERTLADGYAYALAIEAERLGLQRRLEQSARLLGAQPVAGRIAEVSELANGVARADDELTELRTALAALAGVARRLRST
jgi:hypothetical protein